MFKACISDLATERLPLHHSPDLHRCPGEENWSWIYPKGRTTLLLQFHAYVCFQSCTCLTFPVSCAFQERLGKIENDRARSHLGIWQDPAGSMYGVSLLDGLWNFRLASRKFQVTTESANPMKFPGVEGGKQTTLYSGWSSRWTRCLAISTRTTRSSMTYRLSILQPILPSQVPKCWCVQ